jgi:hypothetical protein
MTFPSHALHCIFVGSIKCTHNCNQQTQFAKQRCVFFFRVVIRESLSSVVINIYLTAFCMIIATLLIVFPELAISSSSNSVNPKTAELVPERVSEGTMSEIALRTYWNAAASVATCKESQILFSLRSHLAVAVPLKFESHSPHTGESSNVLSLQSRARDPPFLS